MNYGSILLLIIIIIYIICIIYFVIILKKDNVVKVQQLQNDIKSYPNINFNENNVTILAKKMLTRVEQGYKINMDLILYFIEVYKKSIINWYVKNIGIPKYLFLALLIDEDSIKNKNILTLIDLIFETPQDIRDDLANGYDVIFYYVIYNEYFRKKYKLKYYDYNSDKIKKILNTDIKLYDFAKDGVKNGFYNDFSFIYHVNIPYNTSYLSNFFKSMFLINKYLNNATIKKNLSILYNSIIPYVYGNFINYNGAGRAISRYRYRSEYQNLLEYINKYNPKCEDYKAFSDKNFNNFYNIDKIYLLVASGLFAWYGKNDAYIINSYPEHIENEISETVFDGDLVIKEVNYSHNFLFGDEDLCTWFANANYINSSLILAGCLTDMNNKIISVQGNLEIYDKISGDNIKCVKILSKDLFFYYIIDRNISMITIVIIKKNLYDTNKYYFYPVSIYSDDMFIINNKKDNIFSILSDIKPRYVIFGNTIDINSCFIEINNGMSKNNYGRIRCTITARTNIIHISTQEIKQIPKIIFRFSRPIAYNV